MQDHFLGLTKRAFLQSSFWVLRCLSPLPKPSSKCTSAAKLHVRQVCVCCRLMQRWKNSGDVSAWKEQAWRTEIR